MLVTRRSQRVNSVFFQCKVAIYELGLSTVQANKIITYSSLITKSLTDMVQTNSKLNNQFSNHNKKNLTENKPVKAINYFQIFLIFFLAYVFQHSCVY